MPQSCQPWRVQTHRSSGRTSVTGTTVLWKKKSRVYAMKTVVTTTITVERATEGCRQLFIQPP